MIFVENIATVTYYPYRTAEARNRILSLDVGEEPGIREGAAALRQDLIEMCGRTTSDNHECFLVKMKKGETLVLQYSDFKCYVGLAIFVYPESVRAAPRETKVAAHVLDDDFRRELVLLIPALLKMPILEAVDRLYNFIHASQDLDGKFHGRIFRNRDNQEEKDFIVFVPRDKVLPVTLSDYGDRCSSCQITTTATLRKVQTK